MGSYKLTGDLIFSEAIEIWLDRRTIPEVAAVIKVKYISQKTKKDYICGKKALNKYFAWMRLRDIDPEQISIYQNARAACDREVAHWAKRAGANCIRKEVDLLLRVLRDAGVWKEEQDAELIRVQKEDLDIEKALSAEQQEHWLRVAEGKAEFHFIYWYSLLAFDSTCAKGEMRGLKIGDCTPDDGIIMVRRALAKNKHRKRTIALLEERTIWALERLIERAQELGAKGPQDHLFPFREMDGSYNPKKPMSEWGLEKRFQEVRDVAGPKFFKPNGFRHTGLTRLAEGGTPIHVLLARAGHIDEDTQKHYIQISIAAQRRHARRVVPDEPVAAPAPKKPPVRQEKPKLARAAGMFWISSTTGF